MTTPTLLTDAEIKEIERHVCHWESLAKTHDFEPNQYARWVSQLLSHIAALSSAVSESEVGEATSWLDWLADDETGERSLRPGAFARIASLLRRQAATIVRLEKERGQLKEELERLAKEATDELQKFRLAVGELTNIPELWKRRDAIANLILEDQTGMLITLLKNAALQSQARNQGEGK